MTTDCQKQYRLGLYEKAAPPGISWPERLAAARETGYDFVEMSVDETDERISRLEWETERIDSLRGQSLEAGVPIESICFSAQRRFPLGSGLPGGEEQAVMLLEKAVRFAARLGVRIIQVQGYDCYYDETSSPATRERFFRNLRKGTLYAARYGVILGMETMENDFLNTTEKAMYYTREIDSPYLQVYPDVGNITNATGHVCRDLRTGKGRICAAHLKDTLPGRFREIPYGAGQVDFPSAIRVLWEQGVRRFVAEFWHNPGDGDWRQTLRANRIFLDRQFSAALELEYRQRT